MADVKISELTELAATPEGTDILAIVDDPGGSPVTKRITVTNLLAGIPSATASTAGLATATQITKLDAIEANADVTDSTNVTNAGALMDSEVDASLKTFSLPENTTISTYGATLIDDASASDARSTLDVDQAGTDNSTDVTLNANATAGGLSLDGQEINFRAATNAQTGYATGTHITAIEANTAKNTNVPTALSVGTVDTTTVSITSDGGADDVTLPAATNAAAGVATAAQITTLEGAVQKSTYDAHSILQATTDDTPVAITVAEQTLVGRITSGNIKALTQAEIKTLLGLDYDTLWVGAGAMIPCTTNPAAASTEEYGTNDIDLDILAFDAGATEERAQFSIVMPETWDRSTVKVKFYWGNATGASASDTVEWGIKASAISNDDPIDAALGTPQVITDTVITDGDLHITSATPALTIGGTPALGDLVHWEIYRNTDGTDDMTEDAWLIGVSIQYKKTNVVAAW